MKRPRLARSVVALGVVSLLTDASSEMIYPLLPLFLTGTLGASAAMLGVIEGAAETTAGLLRLWSGNLSDRLRRRKPLVVAGYTLSSIVRPLIAAATVSWHVLAIRVTDRVGKGIRSAPRDALLADATAPEIRGRAYGFHRAMDHAGAVIGPVAAFVLLSDVVGVDVRTVFWLAAIPALLSVVVLMMWVREQPRATPPPARYAWIGSWSDVPGRMRRYLAILAVFTLAGASDAFLLLRASSLGVSVALIPVLWGAHHVVKSALSTAAGALSDRIGRRPVISAGWMLYAVTYVGFAVASAEWHVWALFAAYGGFYALTEGAEKAYVADLVPPDRRGAAFGWFHLVVALGALPASVLFGVLWSLGSPSLAFAVSAAIAMVAAGLILTQSETAPGPVRRVAAGR
jgi:MFS family permease